VTVGVMTVGVMHPDFDFVVEVHDDISLTTYLLSLKNSSGRYHVIRW